MQAKILFNGQWYESLIKKHIPFPADERKKIEIYYADDQIIQQAIESALNGAKIMKKMSRYQRYIILKNMAENIEKNKEELIDVITEEAGKPISLSRGEVNRAVNTFTIAAEETKRIAGEIIPLDIDAVSMNYKGYTHVVPVGVVLAITPFNFPLNLVAHKIAPSIAAGNSTILKPSPQTPLTACMLGKIALDSGLPKEALSIIHCDPPEAEKLVKDERIAMLSFTGSAEVGWHLKKICGNKKIVLEMGGNAAAIIAEDADLDWASSRLATGAFAYSGQICISVQRIFVHSSILEKFLDKFIFASDKIKTGDPHDESILVGPMISTAAADRIENWALEAQAQGAQFAKQMERKNNYIYPAIMTHTAPCMKIWSEEAFGPVVLVEEYLNNDDAIAKVNNSKYGLQASLFTKNLHFVDKAVEEIEVGGIIVNDYPTLRIDNMLYGGLKASGYGKEGLKYAIEQMTDKKMVVIRLKL